LDVILQIHVVPRGGFPFDAGVSQLHIVSLAGTHASIICYDRYDNGGHRFLCRYQAGELDRQLLPVACAQSQLQQRPQGGISMFSRYNVGMNADSQSEFNPNWLYV
jgi:hypothetical protein